MDQEVIKNLVKSCITGDYKDDISPYFNDIETFLKFVIKKGGFHYFEEFVETDPDSFIGSVPFGFWQEMLKLKPEDSLKMISEIYFTDVVEMNGEYYFEFSTYTILSKFFSSVDSSIIYDIIENKPIEPNIFSLYTKYLDCMEVIEELTYENKVLIADYILKKVSGEEMFLDDFQTTVFKDISLKQKNQDTFILTESNIMSVIEDPDSLKLVIEKYTPELIDKLHDIADMAIKNIFYDDTFSFILECLGDVFQGDIFEQGGMLYLKIKNFKKILSNPKLGGGILEFTLTKLRTFWKYYSEFYDGFYIEDFIILDEILFDEINDILKNNLI